jgi:8-oxo-dGTP diphosphatase
MEFKTYPFDTLKNYFSADVLARYKDKWIFCMHKERNTWENPSGHIDTGETPLEAAKRELYEETGALDFDIEPICDYYINGELNGIHYKGNGQVYLAIVRTLGDLPQDSEMGKIEFFDSLPNELTYPILRDFFHMGIEKLEMMVYRTDDCKR